MTPRGLDGVRVSSSTLINKASAVIDGALRAILRIEIPVRCPVITDDRSAGFDPCIYNGLHSVSGYVRNENEKRFTTLVLNTAKHSLPHNRVAPMNLRRPNLLSSIAAVLLRPPIFSEQPSLYTNKVYMEAIVLGVKRCASLDKLGRYAAHDVVCEEHNLVESEVTVLKP